MSQKICEESETRFEHQVILQRELLATPIGIPGSGYTRYGAAMWLFQNGLLTADELETYRICCKHDNENPLSLI